MIKLYRNLVASLLGLQLVWIFFPWSRLYSPSSLVLLDRVGTDSLVSVGVMMMLSVIISVIYLLSCLGLIFFVSFARKAFIFNSIFGGACIFLYGISVQSSYEAFLGYFMTLGDGAIIVLSYSASINDRFNRRSHDAIPK